MGNTLGQDVMRVITLGSRVVKHPTWAAAHVANFVNQVYDRYTKPEWQPHDSLYQGSTGANRRLAQGVC